MGLPFFQLTGKTALVTGCNKGIGKSMAIGLAGRTSLAYQLPLRQMEAKLNRQ